MFARSQQAVSAASIQSRAHILKTIPQMAKKQKMILFRIIFHLEKVFNPHQNDQGRKRPCFFQRLIAIKCLKCQKI
jgi:hypothetical protein